VNLLSDKQDFIEQRRLH